MENNDADDTGDLENGKSSTSSTSSKQVKSAKMADVAGSGDDSSNKSSKSNKQSKSINMAGVAGNADDLSNKSSEKKKIIKKKIIKRKVIKRKKVVKSKQENELSKESKDSLSSEERKIQALLAVGAYHLPGNTWCEDWLQYFRNNHPLFSTCLQDYLHPIPRCIRVVAFVGSVMFGLVLTNVTFLWFSDLEESGTVIFELSAGGFAVPNGTSIAFYNEADNVLTKETAMDITTGTLILWSIGSAMHALFDLTLWYVTSCYCCLEIDDDDDKEDVEATTDDDQQIRKGSSMKAWCTQGRHLGDFLVLCLVVIICAAGVLSLLIRTSIEGGNNIDTKSLTELREMGFDAEQITNRENYTFLIAYALELGASWLVWFPLLSTIFFSGVLSCGGLLPCLRGRAGELRDT